MLILNCSSLHPSGELHRRARALGAGAQFLLRWMLRGRTNLARVPGSFNSVLCLVAALSKHVPALHKSHLGFLLLLCQSHWFSNQLRRLDFLVLDHRARVPHLWFKLLTPLVESVDPGIPPPLCLLLGTQVLTWFFSFPFLPNCVSVDVSYSLGCRRLFLPVSNLFSMRIALHVEVFLMCLQGRVEIYIRILSHLDLSVFNIFKLHLYAGSYTDLFVLIVLWKYHLF